MRRLILSGMNVARLNFSHGTHEQHARTVANIRALAAELGRPIAILGDLQGPRIRVGMLPEARNIVEGEQLVLVPESDVEPEAQDGAIPVTYDELAHDVVPGGTILIDDGLIALKVDEIDGRRVRATVKYGGL